MEKGIQQIDFETVDQMIQVHGECIPIVTHAPFFIHCAASVDYEGVGMSSRDANSKAAASEASGIFNNHYPEFLVRSFLFVPFARS